MPANRREFFRWRIDTTARQRVNILKIVPYHASDADTDEPLSAQESHGHDVLFPSLFDDEGHLQD